ncbi:MAG: gamma-glutamyl-gamma-aminobutyrate hydrolase family protein [Bacilli bacterium]|jgi:putative glutamine amidotransferase|nr:gamma-glutamyl-gamma-aminobutyrate hydrolase family protein [Bacilli bacterium]
MDKNQFTMDSDNSVKAGSSKKSISRKVLCLLVLSLSFFSAFSLSSCQKATKNIGIAWRADLDSEFYTNMVRAIKDGGGNPVLLPQAISRDVIYGSDNKISGDCVDVNGILKLDYAKKIRSNNYLNSNAKSVIGDIKTVIFTGGEDISPSLYKIPEEWHGIEAEKDYNATRDVSDYLTMAYCVANDIKLMGFCRGMQMLGVLSGASVIQDIPTYFKAQGLEYNNEHRNVKNGNEYRDYAPHNVNVKANSRLSALSSETVIENVPSWHHQALLSVENTELEVTGYTPTSGLNMIECIERRDKTYEVGFQFHPEAAIAKNLDKAANKDKYMSYEEAEKFIKAIIS